MSRAVQELKQIPFSHLIGEPLKAAIEAQALAAQTTIEFIHKVGFKQDLTSGTDLVFNDTNTDADAGELRNITFSYTKTDENGVDNNFELTVPLLSITPIPYIRIDEMTIDFSAKLTDSVVQNSNSSLDVSTTASGSFKSWWSPVKMSFRTSVSARSSSSSTKNSNREYSMDIHVRAVQDTMPAGLSKILDILEESINSKKQ